MLRIFRSSRIERLATLLWSQLQATQPQNVLAPQTLVIGHLGMKRWLVEQLASKPTPAGEPGIAANLTMQLPGEWLEALSARVFAAPLESARPYRRESLRWRIYRDLPLLQATEVQRYLRGSAAERRRYQLADRLAGLYAQYLVYRRDWLLAWETADPTRPDLLGHWQGELWRRLTDEIGAPPRAMRMLEMLRQLPDLPVEPGDSTLHVFGLSHLPPDALQALAQLAHSRDVNLYFPDPCRELWEQLRTRHEQLKHGAEAEASYLEIGHPLLASLGRLGQHFSVLLNGLREPLEDMRDAWDQDAFASLEPKTPLLEQLQMSIRLLDPRLITASSTTADASLRVHLCHTRLRELEVLKDALLEFLARDPELQPREIVVMAPNIADYAPSLPTLFGEAGRALGSLPYHLADVSLARTHPLLNAFARLLQLPQQRVSRSQVLGLLALPAVQRRFSITPGGLDALQRWLDRACVAWSLDGPMKADFGAAPIAANSFAFGLDRMFAGYVLGNDDEELLLDECVLPAAPIQGPDVAVLGALDQLLAILREIRDVARESRLAAAWSEWLARIIDALFAADAHESDGAALSELHKLVAKLARDVRAAGPDVDPLLSFSVVSEVLREGLEAIPEQQAFLAGGITFCGMVPQRSVPFKVVCILGLADGEFPRARSANGLDLMQSRPRLGDRDSRIDDRYLFLEALMSARNALHLSFVGEGVRDGKPRTPAAPLAELIGLLDHAHGATVDTQRSWLLRHALQPFDARYFEQAAEPDPRWFSYAQAYAQLAPARIAVASPSFIDGLAQAPAAAADGIGEKLGLEQLERYFKDPARHYCEDVLGLSRRALEAVPDQDLEPLGTKLERRERRHVQMVWAALERGAQAIWPHAPAALAFSGQIAPGALGEAAYDHEREAAEKLLTHARKLPPFCNAVPLKAEPLQVDLALSDGTRISGVVERVYRSDDTLWLIAIAGGSVDFRQLLPLFLQWALLRLGAPDLKCRVALIYEKGAHKLPGDFAQESAQLEAGLIALIDVYRSSRVRRTAYLPRTSYALASSRDDPLWTLEKVWSAREGGERTYEPGYNELLFQDLDPEDAHGSLLRELGGNARHLLRAITGRFAHPELGEPSA